MSIGEFALAEETVGGSLAGIGAGAIFTSQALSPEWIKFRYGERYLSEATNRKFLGIPPGVYFGFTPSFSGNVLHLDPDTTYGVSFARLMSQDDSRAAMDVVVTSRVSLDFTGHVVFPVFVVLKISGALGLPHSASVVTQIGVPTGPTEVLLCRVTALGAVSFDAPTNRHTPYAYSDAPLGFGFMPDGSVENLLNAVALVDEILVARTDLTGVVHPTLDSRLTADMAGSAVADRLAKEITTVRGIDFLVASPASSFNVSRSFAGFHRTVAAVGQAENFSGFASEDLVGAITSGTLPDPAPAGAVSDERRNVCPLVDASTLTRLTAADQTVAYGRLSYDALELTGSVQTSFGSPIVLGTDTLFLTEVQVGDIIEMDNGDFIAVDSVDSDTQITLTDPSPASNTNVNVPRRRFLLSVVTRAGADDSAVTPYVVSAGVTLRFFFSTWQTLATSRFNEIASLFANHEPAYVQDATTSVAGKALLAAGAPAGRAGAVWEVQQLGARVGTNHIHNIDFAGAADGGGGVVNITQRGPTGATGAPGAGGAPGPVGPQGPTGQGFQHTEFFAESGLFNHSLLGSGAQYSFTHAFTGNQILFLTGGNSEWYSPTIFDADDFWTIEDIFIVGGTTCRVNGRVPIGGSPSAQVRFYMNAASKT